MTGCIPSAIVVKDAFSRLTWAGFHGKMRGEIIHTQERIGVLI